MSLKRPGEGLSSRPLHFIFIADRSQSMASEGKIQALNNAIREAIPAMRDTARENVTAQVLVRAISFASGAEWHVATPTPVESFTWNDLTADGTTAMGRALQLVAGELATPPMPERALPPVLVLVTDGQPTDDFNRGLKALTDQPWGKKAVRVAIAIGEDADHGPLEQFMANAEMKPLQANNVDQLVKYIKWVSTAVLKAASSPASQAASGTGGMNVPIPTPPPSASTVAAADVW